MRYRVGLALIAILFSTCVLYSFKITLNDGKVINGKFEKEQLVVKGDNGKDYQLLAEDIYSVENGKPSFYLNADHKYSFNVPEGWILKTDSALGQKLIHLKGTTLHGGKITVMSQTFKKGRTFFDFVQESLSDIKKNEFKLIDKIIYNKVGFDDGLKFDLEIKVSGKTLCSEQISLYRSSMRTNTLVTCVYHPSEKNVITLIFRKFIDSFKGL